MVGAVDGPLLLRSGDGHREATAESGAMRKILYSVAMSLDGYIARPDGSYDWIPDEPGIDWEAFLGRFDTVLTGRRTYEVETAPSASESS